MPIDRSADVSDIESDVTEILADTADIQPKIGTPATSVSADIIAIKADLDDVTNGLAAIKAEVEGLAGAAMRGTDSAALASSLTTHDTEIKTYVDKIDDDTNGLTAIKAEVEGLAGAAMRGTDSAALASVLGALNTAAATGAVSDAKLAMAYLKQLVTQSVSMMSFASDPDDIIVIPGTGADLVFPSVTIAGLPTGCNILRVDMFLLIGALFDTSSSENQIKTGTTDQLFVKASGTADYSGALVCLNFPALGLQVDADAYRGGTVLMGTADIKATVSANGTYNFQSDETDNTKGVESTGGGLELLDVTTIVRVWFS